MSSNQQSGVLGNAILGLHAELAAAQSTIARIREARTAYEAALKRREHGGVAADHFLHAVFKVLDNESDVGGLG